MYLIRNAEIISHREDGELYRAERDVLIEDEQIVRIDQDIVPDTDSGVEVIDAGGKLLVPGFIQTHVHLCQVLFRSSADDMELMDWLRKRIWPLESAHTEKTMDLSCRIGLTELISGGTTTILDMGTLRHTDVIAENIISSGIRAFFGKTMMDVPENPSYLNEDTDESIKRSVELMEKYHWKDNGRVRYAFAPRFAVSCTDRLMRTSFEICEDKDLLFHTHASENRKEVEIVQKKTGFRNIEYFEKTGIASDRVLLAHCVWTDEEERKILEENNIKVLHCPSANLKLSSGIAPIPDYLDRGIKVGLGGDGAPCNNNLSIWNEMRLAALIQKPGNGPTVMSAEEVFRMATLGGAEVLGISDLTGSIEVGKKADIVLVDLKKPHSWPYEDALSALVYSADHSNVDTVFINGRKVFSDKCVHTVNTDDIFTSGRDTLLSMIERIEN